MVARACPPCSSSASGTRRVVIVVSHGGVIGSLVRHVTRHAWPGPGEVIPNGSVHDSANGTARSPSTEFNVRPTMDHDLLAASVLERGGCGTP